MTRETKAIAIAAMIQIRDNLKNLIRQKDAIRNEVLLSCLESAPQTIAELDAAITELDAAPLTDAQQKAR